LLNASLFFIHFLGAVTDQQKRALMQSLFDDMDDNNENVDTLSPIAVINERGILSTTKYDPSKYDPWVDRLNNAEGWLRKRIGTEKRNENNSEEDDGTVRFKNWKMKM